MLEHFVFPITPDTHTKYRCPYHTIYKLCLYRVFEDAEAGEESKESGRNIATCFAVATLISLPERTLVLATERTINRNMGQLHVWPNFGATFDTFKSGKSNQ